jgi:broad specificity phosphatase PhoE
MNSSRVKLQHRPFLTPIWLTAGAAAAAFLFALFVIWVWGTADSTTVIVTRDAEQDIGGGQAEPRLSAAGMQRAQLLARMLGAIDGPGRLDAIYVSNTLRSRLTAAPLAELLQVPSIVAAGDDGKALARRALREHGGGRVLIVARPDMLSAILASLSGSGDIPKLDAENYAAIYIVTVPRIGHANLLRLNY